MRKIFATLLMAAFLLPLAARGEVIATVIEETVTPSVPDMDEDGRIYASVSYNIKVTGAKDHRLRVEYPWYDSLGKPVYFNIDKDKRAISTEDYTMSQDNDTIEGWHGPYHDAFMLKPGEHKLNTTMRIFDETAGKYIKVEGAKKLYLTMTSTKAAPGIVVTSQYIEHNQYRDDNAKGMRVKHAFEANWMKGREIKWTISLHKANGTLIYHTGGGTQKVTATGTATYTFTVWDERSAFFPYSGFKLPRGKTKCYAIIKFYDAKTGKAIPAKGNKKMEFELTR